jgi:hypothetical protein
LQSSEVPGALESPKFLEPKFLELKFLELKFLELKFLEPQSPPRHRYALRTDRLTRMQREFAARTLAIIARPLGNLVHQRQQRREMPDFAAEPSLRTSNSSHILSGFAAHCHPTL